MLPRKWLCTRVQSLPFARGKSYPGLHNRVVHYREEEKDDDHGWFGFKDSRVETSWGSISLPLPKSNDDPEVERARRFKMAALRRLFGKDKNGGQVTQFLSIFQELFGQHFFFFFAFLHLFNIYITAINTHNHIPLRLTLGTHSPSRGTQK